MTEIDIQLQLSNDSPNPVLFTQIKPEKKKEKKGEEEERKKKIKTLNRMLPVSYQADLLAHSLIRLGNERGVENKRSRRRKRRKERKKEGRKKERKKERKKISSIFLGRKT